MVLSIAQYAKRSGDTYSNVLSMVKSKKIKAVRIGRAFAIDVNEKDIIYPTISMAQAAKMIGVSNNTALKLINKMDGVCTRKGTGLGARYIINKSALQQALESGKVSKPKKSLPAVLVALNKQRRLAKLELQQRLNETQSVTEQPKLPISSVSIVDHELLGSIVAKKMIEYGAMEKSMLSRLAAELPGHDVLITTK